MVASLCPHPLLLDELFTLTGVGELADRRTHELSGGQARRTASPWRWCRTPDLLVVDEPTAAMDVKARQAFWRSMRAIGERSRTVLFATHHLEKADLYADLRALRA